MKVVCLILAMLVCSSAVLSQQAPPSSNWDSWKFLIGKWVGEGTSDVGQGVGYFTFEAGLNGKVLVRKNHADYPATKERASGFP